MPRTLKTIISILLFYLIGVMILRPVPIIETARQSLTLCVQVVIPSLFPFFVCSRLLIDLGMASLCSRLLSRWMRPLFGVPGSGALAVVLGILSGYPIGAATVVNLYESGACTKTEGERLLTFCNNAGPLFILGSVGIGMLKNQEVGLLLYLVHLVSALMTGLFFRNLGRSSHTFAALPPGGVPENNLASSLTNAVSEGITNILKVCGFVLFFSVVCAALPWEMPILHALLEITGGIHAMVNQSPAFPCLLPTTSALLALSGASVFLQTAGIILPSGLSLKPYLLGKLVQAFFSFILTFFLCRVLPISFPTFSGTVPTPPLPTLGQLLFLSLAEILIALVVVGIFWLAALLSERFSAKK